MNTAQRVRAACHNSPCANCGGIPPFEDGSRCHPHRIKPGHKGGRYTWWNTMPLCPKCHGDEHPRTRGLIRAATRNGRQYGGQNLRAYLATLTPAQIAAHQSRNGRHTGPRTALLLNAKLTAEQRRENGRRGWRTRLRHNRVPRRDASGRWKSRKED